MMTTPTIDSRHGSSLEWRSNGQVNTTRRWLGGLPTLSRDR
jgi:hypothetical protein